MRQFLFKTSLGDVPIYVQDNKVKTTIVFIHGFKADWSFAKALYERPNHFNVISIDYSKMTRWTFEQVVQAIDEIMANFLRGKHFIVLGHSMGAAIALSLKNRQRITELILVSPLNPSIVRSLNFATFEKMYKTSRAMRKVGDALVKGSSKFVKGLQQNALVQEILNRESDYKDIVENNLMNRTFIEVDLDALFKKHVARYVIGALDQIVPTAQFIDYVTNELDAEIKVVRWARHNPFKDNPDAMHKYLNELVPLEKRFFLTRFYDDDHEIELASAELAPKPSLDKTNAAVTSSNS